jgi:hypothetical protein
MHDTERAHLDEHDLAPWAQLLLDVAYANRARSKTSREDFADGFVSALLYLHYRPAFHPPLDGPHPWPEVTGAGKTIIDSAVKAGPGHPTEAAR